ncbi:hypothetical protein [Novosphingobium sp. 9]|uniref:hypothetical protein n=1 Tax=Novosphingobium sp. 9 TaxID=2025349 RepID=UPI0021B67939|nr:hypothetical protein [Novosphingobium sp. 9]
MPPRALPCLHLRLMLLFASAVALVAAPALARESLGLYAQWGAFRDPVVPRCYAIAMAQPSAKARDTRPYATVGTWPRRSVRNEVHIRLSRNIASGAPIFLRLGDQRFTLTGGGADAWAASPTDNAAILAAMRSAPTMTASSRDTKGLPFADTWQLAGAASAMDAALLGCADLR